MKRSLWMLALSLIVLFFPVLIGGAFFWGLPALQFVPWRVFALDQLFSGVIPLWNPLNGAGSPLFANYQSALLYPPSWLTLPTGLINPAVTAWVMSLTAILHLFVTGWGMWHLTGRIGFSPLGRGVSTLGMGLTLYLVARLGTYPTISAAAWLPWLAWAALGVIQLRRIRDAGQVALFTALLLLAGHAQTAWYTILLVTAFTVWSAIFVNKERATAPPPKFKTLLVSVIGIAAAALLGAGVSSLQLAATAELLGQSQRSDGADYWFALNYSYSPARSLALISPNIFGTPADGSFFTEGSYFEDAAYIGLIPLISAVCALFAWIRRRTDRPEHWRYVPFALIVVAIGFLLALGRYSPVFPFLYEHVPTFDLFQAPVRWHLWTVFGLSLAAGIGVEAWGRDVRSRRFGRWGLAAGIGIGLAAISVMVSGMGGTTLRAMAGGMLATAVFLTAAGVLTLNQPERSTSGHWRWQGLVLLFIAADLVWAAWGLNPIVSAGFYQRLDDVEESSGRVYMPTAQEEVLRYGTWFRFDDYRIAANDPDGVRASGLANLNLLDGISNFNNFEPLLVDHYAAFLASLEQARTESLAIAAGLDTRAWLISGGAVCWHKSDLSLMEGLRDPAWDATSVAHMRGDGGCASHERVDMGTAQIIRDAGNQLTIQVDAARMAWLIVADTDYPGWSAFVDGDSVPIFRVNGAFRAVQVDGGAHTVEFVYQPSWAIPALAISLITLVLMIVLLRTRSTESIRSNMPSRIDT